MNEDYNPSSDVNTGSPKREGNSAKHPQSKSF